MPNRQKSEPGRRTRQRILDATLTLYNERGEPQVSTSLIAAELGISTGNLHYHFRRKDELSAALLDRFVSELDELLPPPGWHANHVEDAWLLLHLLFETMARYRFLFRDLSGIMARDRRAAHRLAAVFERAIEASRSICLGLVEQGAMTATGAEIDALSGNIAVVALYWLSFESARHPRSAGGGGGMARGAYQVLMLVAPFLQAERAGSASNRSPQGIVRAPREVAMRILLTACLAAGLCIHANVEAAAPPPAESFARLPAIHLVRLSPNGDLLAWAANSPQGTEITMHSLKAGAPIRTISPGTEEGLKLRDLQWADDETLLVTLSVTRQYPGLGSGQKKHEFFRTLAVETGGGKSRMLLMRDGDLRYFTSSPQILLLDTGKPGTIIMSSGNFLQTQYREEIGTRLSGDREDSGIVFSLFAVDTRTGHGRLLEGGTPFTEDWIVDRRGNAVAASEWRPETRDFQIKSRDGSGWKTIFESRDGANVQPMALAPDGQAIVALGTRGGARERAWRIPLDGSEITAISTDSEDVQGVVIDPFTATASGIELGGLEPTIQWFDPRQQRIQAAVDKAFAGKQVTIFDQSRDLSRALVGVERADIPRTYFLVDLGKGTADTVGESYPELEQVSLGKREAMKYVARDGLEIPAYLTLPPDRAPKDLPLVVFPHGGPWSRDEPGFDWWAQFLATRGYAVLQPQFRGSVGFGGDLRRAGTRAWGQAMQDDLLDGVDELAERGIIDAKRVCIVGASYGGYAALAGVALTPDRFACAVSVNGVSDLGNMFGYLRSRYGDESDALNAWKDLVGTPYDGSLADVSPAKLIARLKAPILLIHARDDVVVPYAQSQSFARSLASLGKAHEFVTLDAEDHWLTNAESRLTVLQAMERFLAARLGSPPP